MEDVDESYFDWSDEDDIICSSKYISSDEEDDDLCSALAYKPRQKGGSVFKSKHKQDEEDDFEKEMASELSQTMQYLTSSLGVPGSSGASKSTDNSAKQTSEFYDDIYFDSDESDPEESTPGQPPKVKKQKQPRRHKVLSNDELFYDPTMDDRDQEWVNQKRRSYQPRGRRPGRTLDVENNNTIQLPPSDAVLNCPACLTTLCMDCQRHEIYHNQYRAMFVFNCVVNVMERLSYPKKDQKKQNFFKNKKARRNKKQEVELEMKVMVE
ncbi:E2F-associated phosphoprotein [Portunus trituberculatus]|uniref:E2F-associated phosphoprotein n=1 Tax=Portunus trituberculatus TaxID=210409 RepID=A0A5B7DWB4_PORTR|nr:E2F-associated phosphoprotein [Portunus trituberculatus]